jgi:Alpha/beta hydrolase domain
MRNEDRGRTRRERRLPLVPCILASILLGWSASAAAASWWWLPPPPPDPPAPAALPTIREIPPGSGLHGHPYDAVPATPIIPGAPVVDLEAEGYVEREFLMSGGATVYRQSGTWGSNGRWGVSVAQTDVPYATRLLVRYPTDPAKFNGSVVFEWLNITTGGDQDPVWSLTYEELLREGYAYVGVSPQASAMDFLHTWDPERYAALGSENDGQSYDIFTQAARVVREDSTTLLGGLTPLHLIGTGDSQSAFRIVTYANAIQPIGGAFDGLMPIGRAGPPAPIGNGLIATSPLDAQIRTDSTTPVLQTITEGDILELLASFARQSDNSYLRSWELAGAAHIDAHEATYELATIARDVPDLPVPECAFGTPITGTGTELDGINQVNDMPLYEVVSAAVTAMHRWLSLGVAPPHSPRISTSRLYYWLFPPLYVDVVNRDQYGNALGGIRLPEIAAPAQFYSPINVVEPDLGILNLNPMDIFDQVLSILTTLTETARIDDPVVREAGLCLLSGFFLELDPATLHSLYSSHADYVAKFTNAAQAARNAGFITQADYDASIARAQAADIP